MLRAELDKRLGAFRLEAAFEVQPGTTLVLVGESGAGKTTVLRLIAGLERPDRGRIEVDGETWLAPGARELPAWRRRVGYVPQDVGLFPHLSVFENVAFGLRAQGLARAAVRARVEKTLGGMDLMGFAGRRPDALSGGQRQRVALARALITEPRVLLLDEPLSALDLATRRTLRAELRRVLARSTCATLLVTHAPLEAVALGDRILVLEDGRVTQDGTRDQLLRHPTSPYVAEFMGMNLFHGPLGERLGPGVVEVRAANRSLAVVDPGGEDEVYVAVGPREITLHLQAPQGSAQNVFLGPIEEIVPEPPDGERLRVVVASQPALVAEITRHAAESMGLEAGRPVYASFKATAVTTYR